MTRARNEDCTITFKTAIENNLGGEVEKSIAHNSTSIVGASLFQLHSQT